MADGWGCPLCSLSGGMLVCTERCTADTPGYTQAQAEAAQMTATMERVRAFVASLPPGVQVDVNVDPAAVAAQLATGRRDAAAVARVLALADEWDQLVGPAVTASLSRDHARQIRAAVRGG